jgi:hypothetical protein
MFAAPHSLICQRQCRNRATPINFAAGNRLAIWRRHRFVSYVNRRVFRKRDDGDELREVSTESGKGGSEMRLLSGNVSMMEEVVGIELGRQSNKERQKAQVEGR